MKKAILSLLFLTCLKASCFGSTPQDSVWINTRVETYMDYDQNTIKEIVYFRDTSIVCRQIFNDGRLFRIDMYDSIGRPLEITFLYKNGRVMKSQEYAEGIMTRKVVYKKNRKIDIIYLYKNDILVNYIRYGRDGQPLPKKNK